MTQTKCAAAGLSPYEVSNHAENGQESRHNLIYWRGGDYLGIGPGAHGRVSRGNSKLATECTPSPGTWLNQAKNGKAWTEIELSTDEVFSERLLMGLRVDAPFPLEALERETQKRVSRERLDILKSEGFLTEHKGDIQVTPAGRPLLNTLLRELLSP